MEKDDKDLYLTIEDVAQRFGVNVTTVYRLLHEGKLPGFKVGKQWRFSTNMLKEWVRDSSRDGIRKAKTNEK